MSPLGVVFVGLILFTIVATGARIMDAVESLRTALRDYIAKNKQRDADVQAQIKAAVDKALADDEVKDAEELRQKLKTLEEEIAAAQADNPPVEPPVFEPSGNAT